MSWKNYSIGQYVGIFVCFTGMSYRFRVTEIFEPSISKNLTDAELLACVNNSNNVIRKWLDGIPIHTQAVERAIKMVSETTTAVNGEEKRNGFRSTEWCAPK